MQVTAVLCANVWVLLQLAPQVSRATILLQTSRYSASAIRKQKPFLDGDFTRDSSNPLDVYEDMNVKAPGEGKNVSAESPAPAPPVKPTPKAEKEAGADVAKTADKESTKDAGSSASAVQVALASAAGNAATKEASGAKQLQGPATTAAPLAAKSTTQAVAKVEAEPAAANASAPPAAVNSTDTKAAVNESQAAEPIPTVASNSSSCVTRNDARAVAWWVETAVEGSSCVFGVDAEDEGSHCIFSNGQYGSNGWCWTEKDMSAWGSCSDGCPIYGPPAVLGKKLDGVTEVLDKVSEKVDKLATQGTVKAEEPTAKEEAVKKE